METLQAQKNFIGKGEPALCYISHFSQPQNGASFCLCEAVVQRRLGTHCAEHLPGAILGFVLDGSARPPSLSGLRPSKEKNRAFFCMLLEKKVQQV